MTAFITNWAESTWAMLLDSAFLLLIGLLLAGLINLILNRNTVVKYLKSGNKSDVFKAALIGVPLPLCSCSVLPVAQELRNTGVSKGAVASFLISTPESGVDSIMLTYSLTDPLLTVTRPVCAFVSALSAGLWEESSSNKEQSSELENLQCESDCCQNNIVNDDLSFIRKIGGAIRYSFTDLLDDLAPYLLIGYLLAGLVTVLLGDTFLNLPEIFKTGYLSYLGAILIGLPLYICATSSTPLAAALLSLGFSPGAVLVFLMVGPATNIASLVVVSKILKGASLWRYLLTIIVVSVLFGILLDWVYSAFSIDPKIDFVNQIHDYNFVELFSAILLSAGIIYYVAVKAIKRLF